MRTEIALPQVVEMRRQFELGQQPLNLLPVQPSHILCATVQQHLSDTTTAASRP